MAIGGVVINFLAKTTSAIRDIDLLAGSLDQADDEVTRLDQSLGAVQRELDSTGTDARGLDRDLGKAGDGFDALARDVDQTADAFRSDMARMSSSVRDTSGDIDRETGRMRADMGEAGRETGAEFISNIAEGIGSGGGNLQDVVSGTLGGLTNLAATLTGPVGLAAGAAAAGIGLVFNAIRGQAEKARERVLDLLGVLEEVEGESKKAAAAKIYEAWLDTMKEMPDQLRQTVSVLKSAKVSSDDWAAAIAGDEEAAKRVRDQIQRAGSAIIRNQQETGELTEDQQAYLDAMGPVLGLLSDQNSALGDAKELHGDINWLQGKSKGKQEDVTAEVKATRKQAQGLKSDLDEATKDRTAKVKIDYQERWVKGGGGAPTGGYPHSMMAGASSSYNVIQPPIAIVTREQIYRAVRDLLVEGDARNGRAPA